MLLDKLDSDFLAYLIQRPYLPGDRIPSLQEISQELGISVGKLREQLEVARSLGYVSVRPRVGIQRETFNFAPSVLTSVLFGVSVGEATFGQFSELRRHLEMSFWHEAVVLLTVEDKVCLQSIVAQAWSKLRGEPVHVPNMEHRDLHLKIFCRLPNPFVRGLLEAYWEAYAASELTRYSRLEYWLEVWQYHERIVAALQADDFDGGKQLMAEHFSLLPMNMGAV